MKKKKKRPKKTQTIVIILLLTNRELVSQNGHHRFKARKLRTVQKRKKSKQKQNGSAKVQNLTVWDYGALHARNPSTGEEELIFLSIIDNLTAYTFGKQLAHFFKKFLWDTHTLSTVRAEFYAQRFTEFMTKNLLADEEEVEMPSDEEADFEAHVKKMISDGKAPPPRNGGRPSVSEKTTSKTATTTTTTTTTTSTIKEEASENDDSGSKKEEKEKPTKKQKPTQLQLSDNDEKPQEVMSARPPKKPKQKPQRRSSRS